MSADGNANLRHIVIVLTSGIMAACYPNVPLDTIDLEKIRSVALIGFAEPKFQVGSIGGLLEPQQPATTDRLNAAMSAEKLHLGAELKIAIAEALRNEGYDVEESANAWRTDAILDGELVAVEYAPSNPLIGGGGQFTPEVVARVELTEARTGKVLFAKSYDYSVLTGADFRPDAKYRFGISEDMFRNPQFTADGFRASEPLIASAVAAALLGK